jgi:hypothetical protein
MNTAGYIRGKLVFFRLPPSPWLAVTLPAGLVIKADD